MIDPKALEAVAARFEALMPQGAKAFRDELRQNLNAAIVAGFDRYDLVTREEFDVQKAVLAKTRQRLELLEAKLKALEADQE